DEDALPRREPLRQEDEALERAVGQEDPGGIDAVPGGEPVSQWAVAGRRSVREDRPTVALQRRARALGKRVDGEALRRRDAAGERDLGHGCSLDERILVADPFPDAPGLADLLARQGAGRQDDDVGADAQTRLEAAADVVGDLGRLARLGE